MPSILQHHWKRQDERSGSAEVIRRRECVVALIMGSHECRIRIVWDWFLALSTGNGRREAHK